MEAFDAHLARSDMVADVAEGVVVGIHSVTVLVDLAHTLQAHSVAPHRDCVVLTQLVMTRSRNASRHLRNWVRLVLVAKSLVGGV